MELQAVPKREITPGDILSAEAYEAVRSERKKAITDMKKDRRISVGPDVTFYFENYDTMWHQVHEMLRIEKGGEAQIADELHAYNPLIPNGRNLVATMMIEIEDAHRRARVLGELGGIEETISLEVGGDVIAAVAEADVDRTTAAGKASSVHFLKFPFTDAQAAAFKTAGTRVLIGIGHPKYDHMVVMPERVRLALSLDLD